MGEPKYKPTIIVDTREKTPWKFNKSERCNGSVSEKLDTGDYSIKEMEDIFVVERKSSVGELWTCLGQDKVRFFKEMERIKPFKYKFLFLEFSINDIINYPKVIRKYGRKTPIKPEYIFSKLIEIQVKYGVHIIYLGTIKTDKQQVKIKSFINKLFQKLYSMHMKGELE